MIEVYITRRSISSADFLRKILSDQYGISVTEIKRTKNGKPYIENDRVFFSISHSHELLTIALSENPVGIDIEKISERKAYHALYNRLTEEEKREIQSTENFFRLWTKKESFIKLNGLTLSAYPDISIQNNTLYFQNKQQSVFFSSGTIGRYVFSLCSHTPAEWKMITDNTVD